MTTHRAYIGDGVTAELTDRGVVLTTGGSATGPLHTIVLEPETYSALVEFVASMSKRARAGEVET